MCSALSSLSLCLVVATTSITLYTPHNSPGLWPRRQSAWNGSGCPSGHVGCSSPHGAGGSHSIKGTRQQHLERLAEDEAKARQGSKPAFLIKEHLRPVMQRSRFAAVTPWTAHARAGIFKYQTWGKRGCSKILLAKGLTCPKTLFKWHEKKHRMYFHVQRIRSQPRGSSPPENPTFATSSESPF